MKIRDIVGWVLGVALQPGAGWLVAGRPVSRLTDTWVDLHDLGMPWSALIPAVRSVMSPDPTDPRAQRRAAGLIEDAVRAHIKLDEEGALVNAIVDAVEGDPELLRVDQLAALFAVTERSLQRMMARRLGLTLGGWSSGGGCTKRPTGCAGARPTLLGSRHTWGMPIKRT